MSSTLIQKKLVIKKSPLHGYGVFANQHIKAGEIIEECYALTVTAEEDAPSLSNYLFSTHTSDWRLLLGFGSIYNHARDFSATISYDETRGVTIFHASKSIRRGEEIFIDYGEEWFSSRGYEAKLPYKITNTLRSFLVTCARFTLVLSALFGVFLLTR